MTPLSYETGRLCAVRFFYCRSFWQYWVHSLSVHSEHLRAALECSQNRSG